MSKGKPNKTWASGHFLKRLMPQEESKEIINGKIKTNNHLAWQQSESLAAVGLLLKEHRSSLFLIVANRSELTPSILYRLNESGFNILKRRERQVNEKSSEFPTSDVNAESAVIVRSAFRHKCG